MFVILGALILSVILILSFYKYKKGNLSQSTTLKVLVATKNLQSGAALQASDLDWKPWPRQAFSPLFLVEGIRRKEEVVGSVLKESVLLGHPLTMEMLIPRGEMSPLTRALRPGMRAFTVDVPVASALAGLITPGDTVDVIFTYDASQTRGGQDFVSETILRNLRVIAIDQSILHELKSTSKPGKASQTTTKHVTLEVTPKQAETLAVSKSLGTLSLSLTHPVVEMNQSVVDGEGTEEVTVLLHGEKQERAKGGGP